MRLDGKALEEQELAAHNNNDHHPPDSVLSLEMDEGADISCEEDPPPNQEEDGGTELTKSLTNSTSASSSPDANHGVGGRKRASVAELTLWLLVSIGLLVAFPSIYLQIKKSPLPNNRVSDGGGDPLSGDANSGIGSSVGAPKQHVEKKTGRIIFHVGPHKTGSTAIQTSLRQTEFITTLKEDGYLSPSQNGRVLGGNDLRITLQKCFKGHCPREVQEQLRRANNESSSVILSSEQFDSKRPVKKIQQFFRDFDSVQVVVVYRRFYEWILSLYGEQRRWKWKVWSSRGRDKNGADANFVTFLAAKGARRFYNHQKYSVAAYENYASSFDTTFVNMHAGNGDVVENFFCHPVVNATATCRMEREERLAEHRNVASYPALLYDEIVVAAYDAGLVNATAISRFEAHDYFLDGRHNPPGGAGETIETLPMTCPPEEEMELLLRLSLEAERAYFPAFYESPGGREASVRKFQAMRSARSFCSVNVTAVLEDPTWRGVFAKMNRWGADE